MKKTQNSTTNIIHLSINGMSCASCVDSVEKALLSVDGITKAEVNLAEQRAIVYGKINDDDIKQAVLKAGFEAIVLDLFDKDSQVNAEQLQQHFKSLLLKSAVAGFLGIALMIASFLNTLPSLDSNPTVWIIIGLLSGFIMWFSGVHFFIGAWTAFKRHNATMDTLIALATGTAWSYSMLVVLLPSMIPVLAPQVYFETAAIIICFINLGAAMELRVKNKTSEAIQKLIGLQAKTAWVIRADQEYEIDISNIVIDDIIRVRPGEKLAVDGIIVAGEATVNESMLTGEPVANIKQVGDKVSAGTINIDGSFLFKAQRIGCDTLLSQIIEMVRQAQSSKPSIARLVDNIAAFFVPIVIILSIITFLVWNQFGFYFGVSDNFSYAIVTAMTVLVIACPAALGLASPISIIVGVGKAAQYGILIRNGEALQRASNLAVIVLDKTGTITEGRPDVVAVHTAKNIDVTELLQVAASVNSHSNHPLARAIVENCTQQQIELQKIEAFKSIAGKGVCANLNGDSIWVGNHVLLSEQNISTENYQETVDQLTLNAITPVFVARNDKILGIIGIADPIKADSKAAVHRLIKKGLLVIMLSGDNINTAHAVATQVGITQVIAEVLPTDKAEQIKKLQSEGLMVAMVGDGINNAPALATAELGFAIGCGSDIASADITLIRDSLHGVADAIEISTATLTNIKQNLAAAFIYNIIGIPLAAGVFFPIFGILLPPIYAAAAMALCSFTVVSNANRLRQFAAAQK